MQQNCDFHQNFTLFLLSLRYTFNVGIKSVCQTAWILIIGMTRARFYNLRKKFEDNEDGGRFFAYFKGVVPILTLTCVIFTLK